MKIRVPYLVQDRRAGGLVEKLTFDREEFCLDGPVTRRVAVVHLDPETGGLRPGVRHQPPDGDRPGGYEVVDRDDFTADDFLCVNAFATVLGTLYLYEEADALGREIEWAFGAPQLLVVPRAGEWANAFYQRESHSLQLFEFPARSEGDGGEPRTVFTALSQDILAHETAHAVLDGIAPDLYDCLSPQSLAIHEAVADLTALLVAVRSRKLVLQLLDKTGGRLGGQQAFAQVAEEFGFERDLTGRSRHLRSLWNERNLCPDDDSLDELNRANQASRAEPHLLSEVLSGALYRVFVRLHDEYRSRYAADFQDKPDPEFSASGKALFAAREHFKRLVLRSLDYLPPGEVSFADYGRAILASDQASYAGDSTGRDQLVEEFVRRCIVADAGELTVETDQELPAVAAADLDVLVESDWAAYDFAERHRDLFGIPPTSRFRVRPRLLAKKTYFVAGEGFRPVEEIVFKVSWDRTEDNPRDLPLTALRQITVGTTLVVDRATKRVRALLRSDASRAPADSSAAAAQRDDRDLMLRSLVDAGRLQLGPEADDGLGTGARAETSGELTRIRGAGRMLHLSDSAEVAAAPSTTEPKPPPGVDAGAFYDLVARRRRGFGRERLIDEPESDDTASHEPESHD